MTERPPDGDRPLDGGRGPARHEYRIERLAVGDGKSRDARLLERLHEVGPLGWRVVSVDFGARPPAIVDEVTVLLERERRPAAAAPPRSSAPDAAPPRSPGLSAEGDTAA